MKDLFTYLLLMSFTAFFAVRCMYGFENLVITEGDPQELTDSCVLQDINTPNFRGIFALNTIPLQNKVTLKWGIYSVDWVSDSTIQMPIAEAINEIMGNYVSYDSMIVLDKTKIDGGKIVIDFAIFFRNPSGSGWNSWPLNHPFVNFIHEGVGSYQVGKTNERSMLLGSLANDSHDEVISIIEALPGWAKFNMRYTNLDSIQCDAIWSALLANCKTNATVDIRQLPISQERIDQFMYQNITLIK